MLTNANDSNSRGVSEELTAVVPKEQLKTLFYLFTGKPDSRIKTFSSPIHLTHADLVQLNELVTRKLATHYIDAVVTSVRVGYQGSQQSEFGTWAEFETHNWTQPERVEEVVVKWDFLVSIRDYAQPQRHTLVLRISGGLKPSQLFQMLGAGNYDELDQVDVMASLGFCRVDFINAQISKELINVVSDWYEGLRQPELIQPYLYALKKHRNVLASLVDQWMQFSWALIVASILLWWSTAYHEANPPLGPALAAVFLAVFSLRPAGRMASILVTRAYKAIAEVDGSRVVFEFTTGDKKKIHAQKNENRAKGRKFIVASAWNIGLNVVAALLYTWLFSKSMQ